MRYIDNKWVSDIDNLERNYNLVKNNDKRVKWISWTDIYMETERTCLNIMKFELVNEMRFSLVI